MKDDVFACLVPAPTPKHKPRWTTKAHKDPTRKKRMNPPARFASPAPARPRSPRKPSPVPRAAAPALLAE